MASINFYFDDCQVKPNKPVILKLSVVHKSNTSFIKVREHHTRLADVPSKNTPTPPPSDSSNYSKLSYTSTTPTATFSPNSQICPNLNFAVKRANEFALSGLLSQTYFTETLLPQIINTRIFLKSPPGNSPP